MTQPLVNPTPWIEGRFEENMVLTTVEQAIKHDHALPRFDVHIHSAIGIGNMRVANGGEGSRTLP